MRQPCVPWLSSHVARRPLQHAAPRAEDMPQDERPGIAKTVSSTAVTGEPAEPPEVAELDAEEQARISRLFSQLGNLNLYDLLGVARGADTSTIKRAFNACVLDFHPDRYILKRLGPYEAKIQAILTRIVGAEQILCSPERRAIYDAALKANRTGVIESMLAEVLSEMKGRDEFGRYKIIDGGETIAVYPGARSTPRPTFRALTPEELETRRQVLTRRFSPDAAAAGGPAGPPKPKDTDMR